MWRPGRRHRRTPRRGRRARRGRRRRSPPTRCGSRRCGGGAARASGVPRSWPVRCRVDRSAARVRRGRPARRRDGAVSGVAAASMRPSSSATTVTTVCPLPSSRAGTPEKARWRSTKSGSASSSRARSRSPPATLAISSARSGGVPSATRRAAIVVAAIGANSMRTHRDAMVTRSGGTKSASTTKCVEGGGSSSVLSRRPAPAALSRWNSWSTRTLRAPSTGASDAWRTISSAWSLEIAAPTRSTSWTSGCAPASTRRASRLSASSRPVSRTEAKARAARSFVEPGGPTNR